jgi:hypothetical protein
MKIGFSHCPKSVVTKPRVLQGEIKILGHFLHSFANVGELYGLIQLP